MICTVCHRPEDEGNHAPCWRSIYGRLLMEVAALQRENASLRERLIDAGFMGNR